MRRRLGRLFDRNMMRRAARQHTVTNTFPPRRQHGNNTVPARRQHVSGAMPTRCHRDTRHGGQRVPKMAFSAAPKRHLRGVRRVAHANLRRSVCFPGKAGMEERLKMDNEEPVGRTEDLPCDRGAVKGNRRRHCRVTKGLFHVEHAKSVRWSERRKKSGRRMSVYGRTGRN